MSSSPTVPDVGAILMSPTFWPKLAAVDYTGASDERLGAILTGFVDGMKTAGFSPLHTFGIMVGLAGMNENSGQKTASLEELLMSIPMPKLAADAVTAGLTTPPAVQPPAHFGTPAATPLVPGTTSAGGIWNGIKSFFGSDQAIQNSILNTAAKEHPGMHMLASALYGDDHAGLAKFYADVSGAVPGHEKNYGAAASSAWDALKSKPFVKEWAPAVVPGLATMAASRMAGAGWGTSALLGLGAGALHATATNAGGYAPWFNHMFKGEPLPIKPGDSVPGGRTGVASDPLMQAGRPAPSAAAPPAAAPAAPIVPAAQQTMQSNSANAANISGQAPKPAPKYEAGTD